jgi:Skp family chaperone for outer membrane proteins
MKRYFLRIFLAYILIITPCFGNENNLLTVAVIDIQYILNNSVAAKAARSQLSKKQNEWQTEISKKEEDLNKLNQELSKQQSVLSQEAFDEKFRSFSNRVSDVQREFQVKKTSIDQAEIDATTKIGEIINTIVIEIAEKRNLSMVLHSTSTIFYKSNLDITEEVLNILNQKLKQVELKFNLPASNPLPVKAKK